MIKINKSGGKRMNIKIKLLIMFLAILLVPTVVISATGYFNSKSGLEELTEKGLKNSVLLATKLIEAQQMLVDSGTISLEEAQEEVRKQLIGSKNNDDTRNIEVDFEFGENGYFVIFDKEGNTLGHPSIEGRNVWEEEYNGIYFIQEMIQQAANGGGFTYYDFPMPGQPDNIKSKIAYSKEAPYWDWVIGVNAYKHEYNVHTNKLIIQSLIMIAVTLVIGIAVSNFLTNYLSRPINQIMQHAEKIAEGDLQVEPVRFQSTDELGILAKAMNKMTDNLREVIQQVRDVSETVSEQSNELSQSANEVMQGSEQIVATMEELASGTEKEANYANDLSHTMRSFLMKLSSVSDNGQTIHETSNQVRSMTTDGYELMKTSTSQMNRTNEIVREAVEKVQSLDKRSQEISQLVSVIQDIAEQTNLLALNAAIEAARAGEQGKGFAVVADEVRKLAEEVSVSVADITGIVTGIQRETSDVTESLRLGYEEVEKGTQQIAETGETFNQISGAIGEMANSIQAVTNSLSEISEESHGMGNALDEIVAISEESAAGIEETTASSEQSSSSMSEVHNSSSELAKLADELNRLVQQFKI